MFNRHQYEKLQTEIIQKTKLVKLQRQFSQRKKNKLQNQVTKYKAKVRNFLVQLAWNPIQLGLYQPPIKTIQRTIQTDHRLGAPQMFINGFKTNNERIKQSFEENKILDYSPMKISLKNQSFRQRNHDKQIQPQMKFVQNRSITLLNISRSRISDGRQSKITKSHSLKNLKFPSLTTKNPQKKTYFKAIQQMGNSLKMMEQSQNERIGLQNRLMIVMDGKQAQIESTALDLLVKCKLLKKRVKNERNFHSLKTFSSNI